MKNTLTAVYDVDTKDITVQIIKSNGEVISFHINSLDSNTLHNSDTWMKIYNILLMG